ncbi:bifunctional DNA primase/polymerase [Vibrio atypicus]|uniref:bifunctional DNA primase/polymerase n=1 Tax=Vibrio atypicus TaxID=558271 RepID=UPI003734D23C
MAFGDKVKEIDFSRLKALGDVDDQAERIYRAALIYIDAGYYVLPLDPQKKGGKSLPPSSMGISYAQAAKSKKTIDSWFGLGGRFRGYNLGIACGKRDGVFAVDVDVEDKRGNKGVLALEMLEQEHGKLPETQTQHTASGGTHYIFQWSEGAKTSSGKLAKAIDTRGGDVHTCRSHIVVYPSKVANGSYQMMPTSVAPAEPPLWVLELLSQSRPKKLGIGRGSEEISSEDVEDKYTIRQLWKMLEFIDPDELEYEEWLYCLQAIHSQYPNEAGFEIADRWSQRGARYKPNEISVRWGTFDETGDIRIGSLIYFAQQGGFNPKTEPKGADAPSQDAEEIVDEYNSKYAMVLHGGKLRVMVETPTDDPFKEPYTLITKGDFMSLTEHDVVFLADANGNSKRVQKSKIWRDSPDKRIYEGGLVFEPGKSRDVGNALNMWRGWQYAPVEGDWSLFKQHIMKVCGRNEQHYNWLLDWMADAIQDPMNPKGCAVILKGVEGAGKGTIFNIFGELFGRYFKHLVHEDQLVGKFNAHMQESLFVFADEVTYGGSKKVAGVLKGITTEKSLMVERKGLDAVRYRNCMRLGIASNESWFIPAGPQSRRWFILEVPSDVASKDDYFTPLYRQMEKQGGYEAMMYELMNREIESNLKVAPETEILHDQRMRLATADCPVTAYWIHVVESGDWNVSLNQGNDRISRSSVIDHAMDWMNDKSRTFNKRVPTNGNLFWADSYKVLDKELVKPTCCIGKNTKAFKLPTVEELAQSIIKKTGIGEIDYAEDWSFLNEGMGNENVESEDVQ